MQVTTQCDGMSNVEVAIKINILIPYDNGQGCDLISLLFLNMAFIFIHALFYENTPKNNLSLMHKQFSESN